MTAPSWPIRVDSFSRWFGPCRVKFLPAEIRAHTSKMPVSFLSSTVLDHAPLPSALQIRLPPSGDSPSPTFDAMHALQHHLFVPCTDSAAHFQPLVVHPESPHLHSMHLSQGKCLVDSSLSGTFSLLERDRRPSATVIDTVGYPCDEDMSPASSTSGDSVPVDNTIVSDFGNCTLKIFFARRSRVVRVRCGHRSRRLWSLSYLMCATSCSICLVLFHVSSAPCLRSNVYVSQSLSAPWCITVVLLQACHIPVPMTLWELRSNYAGPLHSQRSVWAVYKSHDEVRDLLRA